MRLRTIRCGHGSRHFSETGSSAQPAIIRPPVALDITDQGKAWDAGRGKRRDHCGGCRGRDGDDPADLIVTAYLARWKPECGEGGSA